jgi:hypothetical protein
MQAHLPLVATARWAAAAAIAFVLCGGDASATRLSVRTISNGQDSVSEFRPRIAGSAIVWQRGSGASAEVMRWDGTQAVKLTNNGVPDENPETDGIHVVWQSGNAGSRDLAFYDLVTRATSVVSSTGDEVFPLVSGIYVSWVELVDADGEVFIDPGPIGNQITGNSLVESQFLLEDGVLVWSEGDEIGQTPGTGDDDHDIALWNGPLGEFYILGGFATDDIRPSLAGDTVVWQAGPDGAGDIWVGDTQGTVNVLFDGADERNPHTDGVRVVWEHHDGQDLELYRVDLASPNVATPVTSDTVDDLSPWIEGSRIVWVKDAAPGDSEIWFIWSGGPPELLSATRNNGRDDVRPRLDGDRFVYESCSNLGQPNELCDVVLVPEPRATLAVGAALSGLLGLATLAARRARDAGRR